MRRKDIPPGNNPDPFDGDQFDPGEFEDIDLPGGEGEAPTAESFAAEPSAEGVAEAPTELLLAKEELVRRLIIDAAPQALSAETGTDAYGFENIIGVGISEKLSGGEYLDDLCVTVYVMNKAPKGMIASEALVPEKISGIPTDVVATGELVAQPYRGRYRPAPGGVSVGHHKVTAGTIGCLAKRGSQLYILSNNHVLANSNNAAVGDPVIQPGSYDGGRVPRDVIAKLTKWVPIRFGGPANFVDCAIAQTSPRLVTPRNIAFGRISCTPVAGQRNMLVKKAGRTTQATRGRITDVNATVRVNYGPSGVAVFSNQIVVQSLTSSPFSQGGDSGSLIMTATGNQPVALLFAGSASHTIANPIQRVIRELGITIVC